MKVVEIIPKLSKKLNAYQNWHLRTMDAVTDDAVELQGLARIVRDCFRKDHESVCGVHQEVLVVVATQRVGQLCAFVCVLGLKRETW